jgi:hypothetical protein
MGDVDLTGGLDPAWDGALLEPPRRVAGFGENHAFWVFDDSGRRALLHCHLQADPDSWRTRREAFGIALPNGRLLVDWATGEGTTVRGPRAKGWEFVCEEPYRRWSGRYRGTPRDASAAELERGVIGEGRRVPVEMDLDMRMGAPPWVQGTLSGDSEAKAEAMTFIGGDRYEQLCRVRGELRIGGERTPLSGTGLRTHRTGVRSTASIGGHCWASALFPSGRAFGLQRFPNPDWTTKWSEAFVSEGGALQPAQHVASPWLTRLDDTGNRFEIVLDTAGGPVRIEGEQVLHSHHMGRGVDHAPGTWTIVHAMARYRWHGEEAYGLLERSAPVERLNASRTGGRRAPTKGS